MLHLAPGQTVFDVALVLYAAILIPVIATRAGRGIARDPDGSLIPRYRLTVARGWLVIAMLAILWTATARPIAALGLDWPIGAYGRYGLVLLGIGVIVAGAIQLGLKRLITPARYAKVHWQMRAVKLLPRTTSELLLFLVLSLTAGLWEELLFRGFLIWFFAPYLGLLASGLIASVIFGIGHAYQGPAGVLRTSLIGIVFAAAYLATGSLWWLIGAHALLDVHGGLVAWRVMRMPEPAAA